MAEGLRLRGSIPSAMWFSAIRGNMTCLRITFTDTIDIAIIDAGQGTRNLGREFRAIGHKQEQSYRVHALSLHHIQGFPFFARL